MEKVEVTLRDGSKIKILPGEVEGLRKLGKLRVKEEKKTFQTKEEKKQPETKEDKESEKQPLSTERNLKNVKSGN